MDWDNQRIKIMDNETNRRISDYVSAAAKQDSRVMTAYLFGSYAAKKDRVDSDIDVALIINSLDNDRRFDLQVKLMLLASEFDIRIEPHPISNEDFNYGNPFAAEIIKNGVEVRPFTAF